MKSMSNTDFNGKTVIITGASAGVGAACAELFAAQGARLVLVARGQEALQEQAEAMQAVTEVLAIAMDVADERACRDLIDRTVEQFGGIDVLVNNAGLHHRGDFASQSPENMAQMIDVNLRAPIFLTGLALPHLQRAGGGAVVMVGSLAGRTPMRGAATYASTKAGLRSLVLMP